MIQIDTNAFTATFPVYKDKKNLGRISVKDFGKQVCAYCYENKDYQVVLTGNSNFLFKMQSDIFAHNKTDYANNKEIEVYINEISS